MMMIDGKGVLEYFSHFFLFLFFIFVILPYGTSMFSYHVVMQILKINPEKKDIDSFVAEDFKLIGYDPHQKIEMKMAV